MSKSVLVMDTPEKRLWYLYNWTYLYGWRCLLPD